MLPEVGDEVLVAFEQGDIRRPYVVGGLFNGVDTPKPGPIDDVDGGSGAINRRSLVSRRGHRIDLLDQDGRKEGIALATGDGKHTFTLDATGSTVTLHSDGSVTIEAQERRHGRRGHRQPEAHRRRRLDHGHHRAHAWTAARSVKVNAERPGGRERRAMIRLN